MSKIGLQEILKELSGEITQGGKIARDGAKLGREQVVNYLTQELYLSKTNLVNQLKIQLVKYKDNPKFDQIIQEAVERGYNMMYARAKAGETFGTKGGAKYSTKVVPQPDGFIVQSDASGDKFSRLRRQIVLQGLDEMRVVLNDKLPEADTKDLLDIGHSDTSPSQSIFLGRLLSGRAGVKFDPRSRPGTSIPLKNGKEIVSRVGDDVDPTYKEAIPLALSIFDTVATNEIEKRRILEIASEFDARGDKNFRVTLELESSTANRSVKEEESRIVSNFRKALSEYVAQRNSKGDGWAGQEGSDSKTRQIAKTLIQKAVKAGGKFQGDGELVQPIKKDRNKVSYVQRIKEKTVRQAPKIKANPNSINRPGKDIKIQPSLISMIELINAKLPPQVMSNMRPPRLENRTGRFADSAKVVDVRLTPQGYPSFGYTYQRSPYDVFDSTLGAAPWNTPGRNPRDLVELSIRQIATGMNLGRFFLRRV